MAEDYKGNEKREFLRYDYSSPLSYKEIDLFSDKNTISKLFEAVSKNLSVSGISFISQKAPNIAGVLLMNLDYGTAEVCREIEKRALIVDNKLIGKVVRIENREDGFFDVGVAFVKKTNRIADYLKGLVK